MGNAQSTSRIIRERMEQDRKEEFASYVYRRVKQQNPKKEVIYGDSCVIIQDKDADESLHLFTFWEMLGNTPTDQASEVIDWAIGMIEEGKCSNLYMLFPKTPDFSTHIAITSQRLDRLGKTYTLKLIPYRINESLAKQINYIQGENR